MTATTRDAIGLDEARRTHLQQLEAESIHIMREVVAQFESPVMLYSIGKDSSVMLHLARKAFHPGSLPFPLLHIDTTWKFGAMIKFRDRIAEEYGLEMRVHTNPRVPAEDINPFDHGSQNYTDIAKTDALKQALSEGRYDAAFGGARRDEEKSRAKERFFSFRDEFGQWDPKNQRPELWNIYNSKIGQDESIRIFPLSNWTELDVWQYLYVENVPINPLYFAEVRDIVVRGGQLIPLEGALAPGQPMGPREGEKIEKVSCRFRTLGCVPCTGAIRSEARTLEAIIEEMMVARTSERTTRVIDYDQEGSMEQKKREGYF